VKDYDKEIVDDKLTQADLIKLMLHNAQHMATREEVKEDITKVETSLTNKIDKVETSLTNKIDKLETSLKEDIAKVEVKIDKLEVKIDKVDSKFDRVQWLIVATILTVLSKDYILGLLK
jgi:chaperonin cofactor prefoldin